MAKKNVFVVPHGKDWAVRKAGNDRVSAVYGTKEKAKDAGRKAAKAVGVELIVQNKDGKITSSERLNLGMD